MIEIETRTCSFGHSGQTIEVVHKSLLEKDSPYIIYGINVIINVVNLHVIEYI